MSSTIRATTIPIAHYCILRRSSELQLLGAWRTNSPTPYEDSSAASDVKPRAVRLAHHPGYAGRPAAHGKTTECVWHCDRAAPARLTDRGRIGVVRAGSLQSQKQSSRDAPFRARCADTATT